MTVSSLRMDVGFGLAADDRTPVRIDAGTLLMGHRYTLEDQGGAALPRLGPTGRKGHEFTEFSAFLYEKDQKTDRHQGGRTNADLQNGLPERRNR